MSDSRPKYYVQGESVRGEPRVYWVAQNDARGLGRDTPVTRYVTDRRQAERWLNRILAGEDPGQFR